MTIPELTIRVENHGDSAIARVENTIFPEKLTQEQASRIKVRIVR
jgi:hypothetical protein